jgi:hypothetical protein
MVWDARRNPASQSPASQSLGRPVTGADPPSARYTRSLGKSMRILKTEVTSLHDDEPELPRT